MDPDSDFSAQDEVSDQHDQESEAALDSVIDKPSSPAADSDEYRDSGSDESSVHLSQGSIAEDGIEKPSRRRKRSSQQDPTARPFKRQKGTLNQDYLELLNREIDDAAQGVCLDVDLNLPHTQFGLTSWSPWEKHLSLEALSRLGRYDLPSIASRVGSKGVIEIKHYIGLLQDAHDLRRRLSRRPCLTLAEFPAAVEISPQCCHAQEEAADAIALRQEQREMQREEAKWGCHWDITPEMAAKLDQAQSDDSHESLLFAQIFHLGRWLKLSKRVFMNSSVPSDNWKFVDDVPPSMWATAFQDFHSLAVSFTRRLVQTTLFISMSRIRAKKELVPNTRDIVRKKDVEAAIASLGVAPNPQNFWLGSARRLRLNVYREQSDQTEESADELLSYDEVEHSLGQELSGDEDPQSEAIQIKQEETSDKESNDEDSLSGSDAQDMTPEDREQHEIRLEANELLWHSAVDLQDVRDTRRRLEQSIAMERWQERQAERRDEYDSYKATNDMWDVLQRKPPVDIPKKQEPGPIEGSNLDVESSQPARGDWAGQLKYRSEWESWTRSNLR
ncbi:hypothetical protein HIM_00659 [Hirsutella minnesotensis 3608]|nr:hypothetical protein HIM_00659 [Hirsutella minnesotensis 3608]